MVLPVQPIAQPTGFGGGARFDFLRATHPGGPHANYKDSVIEVYRRAGLTVLTYDQQSHGDSEGVVPGARCFFERFDDLAVDLLKVRAFEDYHYTTTVSSRQPPAAHLCEHLSHTQVHESFAAALPPGLPIFWMGLSMGGAVIVRASQLQPVLSYTVLLF